MTAQDAVVLNATARAAQLLDLTERLTERLSEETRAFEERRPQDVAVSMRDTQDMANAYRRESARLKAAPSELAPAPLAARRKLVEATRTFEAVLARHASAVEAARVVSEGLVRTIAAEVASQRGSPSAYGASGRANSGDDRAIAFNRTA